jgi:hypothetical protein
MTVTGNRNGAKAFLHHAGLFAGILAVIAGILGMHVMTGTSTHSAHSPASVATITEITANAPRTDSATVTGHAARGGKSAHAGHTTHGAHAARGAPDTTSAYPQWSVLDASGAAEQCSCSGSCADGHAMTAACTPSAKTGSLAAPLPGTTVVEVSPGSQDDGIVPGLWSYIPGSPSPGELSISRT